MQTMDCYVFTHTHTHTHAQSETVCFMFATVCAWTKITKPSAKPTITWFALSGPSDSWGLRSSGSNKGAQNFFQRIVNYCSLEGP